MRNPFNPWLALSVCLAAGAPTSQAFGQDLSTLDADQPEATAGSSDAAPEAREVRSRLVEEIVVTAQKREENLRDVPISISAFSAEQLDARGITDPRDLPLATPGLTLDNSVGFTITYLRGIGSDAFLLADPSVAMYVDGVYYPFSAGQAQNLGAVERVEILKGPQGTLFGRNAVGGAINVVTAAPDFSGPAGSIQTSYSRFDDFQSRAYINVPLTDTLAFSVSGIYGRKDDYRDGLAGGEPLPGEQSKGARVKVRWAPMDALDLTLAAYRMEQQGSGSLFSPNTDPTPVVGAGIQPQSAEHGSVDVPGFADFNDRVVYGQATVFTDWFDVKLLGSDESVRQRQQLDFDGSPTPLVSFNALFFGDIKTAELQLVSNDASWDSDRLKWILGYYYFHGYQGIRNDDFAVGATLLDGVKSVLDPVLALLNLPPILSGDAIRANGSLKNDSNSVYAQATYDFTDWMDLTLGLRAQDEKREIVKSSGSLVPIEGMVATYVSYSGQADTTRSLSPKVSLDFHPWENGLVYLSYQKATKSSTFNVVNFLRFTEPEPVKAERLSAYELGLKTRLFDDTATLSAAAFYYDLRNLQVQFISLLSGGAVTFENAPRSEVKGVEVDFLCEVLPSHLHGLVFGLSGAYLDGTFTDYEHGQGFNPTSRVYTSNLDLDGERIPRTPRFSGTVTLSQALRAPGGSVEIGADYYYNSGFYYLAQNEPFSREKAYGLLGARLSYLYEPWKLRVTLFGKNVLGETYNESRFVTDFGTNDVRAAPATYGMRLNWEF